MKYRIHRLEVKEDMAQVKLESFLNQLEGEVIAIVPYVTPTFQGMGATSKVDFLLIVEKANYRTSTVLKDWAEEAAILLNMYAEEEVEAKGGATPATISASNMSLALRKSGIDLLPCVISLDASILSV